MSRILIVGASSGIGSAIARQLLDEGNEVVAVSRENKNDLPGFIQGDVTGEDALPDIEGPLDGLVYCPGSINLKPFRMLKDSDFEKDMEVNFFGLVRTVRKYLPLLQQSEKASIVLFSTVAVQKGMPFHASIAAAKGAVEGFGRSLAAELAPKIRVNVMAPSLTDTPLAARLLDSESKQEAARERHPLKVYGNPEDAASLAVWLLGAQSVFMSGQVLGWDGGISSLKM
jgi:3-oxoacyl-[acyl-carrier protein] reductase